MKRNKEIEWKKFYQKLWKTGNDQNSNLALNILSVFQVCNYTEIIILIFILQIIYSCKIRDSIEKFILKISTAAKNGWYEKKRNTSDKGSESERQVAEAKAIQLRASRAASKLLAEICNQRVLKTAYNHIDPAKLAKKNYDEFWCLVLRVYQLSPGY